MASKKGNSGTIGANNKPPKSKKKAEAEERDFDVAVRDVLKDMKPDFGQNKVFIHNVYEKFKLTPEGKNMSRQQFNNWLIASNKQGKLTLSRADLVSAMNPTDVKNATTKSPTGAEFQFIRLDR